MPSPLDYLKGIQSTLGKDAAAWTTRNAKRIGIAAGGILAAGTASQLMIDSQNRYRTYSNNARQERELNEKKKARQKVNYNYEELNGYPQELYKNRNGHTNSWGGRQY